MQITIIHNPRCSKSREALKYLDSKNISYTIRNYLKNNLTKEELVKILSQLDINIQDLLRKNEDDYKIIKDQINNYDENKLIEYIITHPKLIQRPIIINESTKKAIIARPTEKIDEVLN